MSSSDATKDQSRKEQRIMPQYISYISLESLTESIYPRAIADPMFTKFHSKLLKVNRLDWWEVFCMQVKDEATCEAFIAAYENSFDVKL